MGIKYRNVTREDFQLAILGLTVFDNADRDFEACFYANMQKLQDEGISLRGLFTESFSVVSLCGSIFAIQDDGTTIKFCSGDWPTFR